LVRVQGL